MKRVVNVLGKELTVKQAKELISQIHTDIHALGPAKGPQYDGLRGKELTQMVAYLLSIMMKSLKRKGAPKNGVVTQFGVDIQLNGWTLSLMPHGMGYRKMVANIKTAEFGKNEDGETELMMVPSEVLEAAGLGLGKIVSVWDSNCWVSAILEEDCPKTLIEARKRYVAFESSPGFEKFTNWFEKGVERK